MKTVRLQPLNDDVTVRTETALLETLIDRKCNVAMACGGQGLCATCHVRVIEGADQLSPISERERRTLSVVSGADSRSRLACQARVLGMGVTLEIPEGMYLEKLDDLDTLVGRRAEQSILHPTDGRVLIAAGKIITRSRIRELNGMDFDSLSIRKQSRLT